MREEEVDTRSRIWSIEAFEMKKAGIHDMLRGSGAGWAM